MFTISDKLSSLALGDREEMYDLLFRAAWKTLKGVIADEQLFEAAVMVLHTRNQKLGVGKGVRTQLPERPAGCCAQLSPDPVSNCDGNYLCDSEELKAEFRDNFLAGLKRLHANGKLKLNGDWEFLQDKAAFDDWLKPLESKTWVAYIEPPCSNQPGLRRIGHADNNSFSAAVPECQRFPIRQQSSFRTSHRLREHRLKRMKS